jgi:hypothetical protein
VILLEDFADQWRIHRLNGSKRTGFTDLTFTAYSNRTRRVKSNSEVTPWSNTVQIDKKLGVIIYERRKSEGSMASDVIRGYYLVERQAVLPSYPYSSFLGS